MKCMICNTQLHFYFSKRFDNFIINEAEYFRCGHCGFVFSKTHAEMTGEDWGKLNLTYHASFQGKETNTDDPSWLSRLAEQAHVINDVQSLGILQGGNPWLDYGCGDGKLSEILTRKYNLILNIYDKYMDPYDNKQRFPRFLQDKELIPGRFNFVINTSVFEHFRKRHELDQLETLVSNDGVFGIHTVVCENIPQDESWFYLLPVHCAFFTNKSMELLFQQWGYNFSLYNVNARLWLWFKDKSRSRIIKEYVENANKRIKGPFYIYKNGFVDYWK